MQSKRDLIIELIEKDRVDYALEYLKASAPIQSDIYNEIVLLKARFYRVRKLSGIITIEEVNNMIVNP